MQTLTSTVEHVPIGQLKTHPQNPRQGDVSAIVASMHRNGVFGAIVAQRSTCHVLAGNHRLLAAREVGLETLPVAWADVDDAHALRILAADNRTSDLGTYDDELLATILQSISVDGGLDGTGYDQDDLDGLLASLTPDLDTAALNDPDPTPPELAQARWQVQPGDVWRLGAHVLACGDSTCEKVAALALDGAEPQLMVTDPPYGVEYDASWRDDALGESGVGRATGKVKHDDDSSWLEAYRHFQGAVVYCWHACWHASTVEADLKHLGFEIRAQIIWAKSALAISRGHYHWQHEPCWYAVRKGKTATWQGDRKQSTLWQIDKPQKSETGHSTQKPIECMARPIINHTLPGEHVYEPFSGSGTTIMACEQLGRICHAIELNPEYVAVTLSRWSDATGQTPVRDT